MKHALVGGIEAAKISARFSYSTTAIIKLYTATVTL